MSTPHVLYRFFDDAGTLLYVGITLDPSTRWKTHSKTKAWWHGVTTITIEEYDSRPAVLAAETAAIITEHPVYNLTHNHPPRPRRAAVRAPFIEPGTVLAVALERRARLTPDCTAVIGTVTSCDRHTVTLALISPSSPTSMTIRIDDFMNFRPIGLDSFYSDACDERAPADLASLRRFKADWDAIGHRNASFTVGPKR